MTRLLGISACALLAIPTFFLLGQPPVAPAQPKPDNYWNVDDVRIGMKGVGKTVIKGTKIESFDAEILGVMRNISPGRDMILARLSGAGLEKTGVIAGMSGSPVYIQGKLLGAVAYAWPYGKEPIAGITPFSQMREFVASYEKRDLAAKSKPARIGLSTPLLLEGREYERVTVSNDHSEPSPTAADGLWMVPLKTPLMTTGMSPRALAVLRDQLQTFGVVPMQGGGVAGNIPDAERNIPLEAGGALSVAMITGDFDMSGIGTVTHIEGKRVYGWGHPFMNLGGCDLPLMTGFVHVINPRLTTSFKMGSPLQTVGVINADVSTCIAGWLGRQPDMLPVNMTVLSEPAAKAQTFNVKVVRQKQMVGSLVVMALTNAIDMEGDLPDDITAQLKVRVDLDGREPLILQDMFSGPMVAGQRGPQTLFAPVGVVMSQLTNNTFDNLRIKGVEAVIEILPGRRTAEIESMELESDTLAPGDTLKAHVTLRPYKAPRQRVTVNLPLPADMPEGSYNALLSDDIANARADLRDNPQLGFPQSLDHLIEGMRVQLAAKRSNLTLRVPMNGVGVAMPGKTYTNLPPSMVQILGSGKRSGTQTIYGALVARQPTDQVIVGADLARFTVTKNKRTAN